MVLTASSVLMLISESYSTVSAEAKSIKRPDEMIIA